MANDLHHKNASSHSVSQTGISSKNVELITYSFSPDLSRNGFFLFLNIKHKTHCEQFSSSKTAVIIYRTLVFKVPALQSREWLRKFHWACRSKYAKSKYFENYHIFIVFRFLQQSIYVLIKCRSQQWNKILSWFLIKVKIMYYAKQYKRNFTIKFLKYWYK